MDAGALAAQDWCFVKPGEDAAAKLAPVAALNARLADPAFFRTGGAEVARATARLDELERELASAYARWTDLEG